MKFQYSVATGWGATIALGGGVAVRSGPFFNQRRARTKKVMSNTTSNTKNIAMLAVTEDAGTADAA